MNRVTFRLILNSFYFGLIRLFPNNSCSSSLNFEYFADTTLHFVAPGKSIKFYIPDDFYGITIGINFVFKSHPNLNYYLIEVVDNYSLNFLSEIKKCRITNKVFFIKGYNHPRNFFTILKFLIKSRNNKNKFIFLQDFWHQDFIDKSDVSNYFPCNVGSTLAYLPSLTKYFLAKEFVISGFDFSSEYTYHLDDLKPNIINKNLVVKTFYDQLITYNIKFKFHKKSNPF
jgi:hypothetical protein